MDELENRQLVFFHQKDDDNKRAACHSNDLTKFLPHLQEARPITSGIRLMFQVAGMEKYRAEVNCVFDRLQIALSR